MNDAGGVCGDERGSDLNRDVEDLGQFPALPHILPECDAFDELSGDEGSVFRAADFVDGEDVWMIESGCGLRFLNKAVPAALMSGKFGEQEFQSDRAAEFGVLRPIHLPQSTRTNFADDAIA